MRGYAIRARASHGETRVCGDAAAGGPMLALAADQVWCRAGTVLNLHYPDAVPSAARTGTFHLPDR